MAIRCSFPSSQRHWHQIALGTVTTLALLTRFGGLGFPSEIVFDEFHIITFVSHFLRRTFFFDVHPPLGRLIYTLVAWVAGYDGNFEPTMVGESYIANNVPYLPLRMTAATLSTLTIAVVYLILWESGHGIPACILGSGMLLLDTAHIIQTRTIYLDAILVFCIACSLLAYIKFCRFKNRPFSRQWWMWLLLTGVALSCTISTKFVGLFTYTTLGAAIAIDLWDLFDLRSPRAVRLSVFAQHMVARLLGLVVAPFGLYVTWFYINFAILTITGPGSGYMSREFQETLLPPMTPGGLKTMAFWRKYLEMQRRMLLENGALEAGDHPYESRPYHWPLASRGVLFWRDNQRRRQIFFVGNVAGWWIVAALLVVFVGLLGAVQLGRARGIHMLGDKACRHLHRTTGFFFFAWAVHYLPFFLMSRQLMLHCYLPSHMISVLVASSLLDVMLDSGTGMDALADKRASKDQPRSRGSDGHVGSGSSTRAWIGCGGILSLVFAFWYFWFPLTYGFPDISARALEYRDKLGYRISVWD